MSEQHTSPAMSTDSYPTPTMSPILDTVVDENEENKNSQPFLSSGSGKILDEGTQEYATPSLGSDFTPGQVVNDEVECVDFPTRIFSEENLNEIVPISLPSSSSCAESEEEVVGDISKNRIVPLFPFSKGMTWVFGKGMYYVSDDGIFANPCHYQSFLEQEVDLCEQALKASVVAKTLAKQDVVAEPNVQKTQNDVILIDDDLDDFMPACQERILKSMIFDRKQVLAAQKKKHEKQADLRNKKVSNKNKKKKKKTDKKNKKSSTSKEKSSKKKSVLELESVKRK